MNNDIGSIVVSPTSNTLLLPTHSRQHTIPGGEMIGGSNDPAHRSRETTGELQEGPNLTIQQSSERPGEALHNEETVRDLDTKPGPSEGPGGPHNAPSGASEAQVVVVPVVPRSDNLSGGGGSNESGNVRQYIYHLPPLNPS